MSYRIFCFTISTVFCVFTPLTEGSDFSRKILYFSLSAGFEHSAVKSIEGNPSLSDIAITGVCKPCGIEVVCTKDGRVFEGDLNSFDAFVFQTSGDLFDGTKQNPEWALTRSGWDNFKKSIRNGKGLLALHPTTESCRIGGDRYKNNPENEITDFTKMVGAEFTAHGKPQETRIRIVQPSDILWLKERKDGFSILDEWYVHKNFAKDIHVLAILETSGIEGEMYRRPPCPIVWCRAEGKGRVFYSGFGHFNKYWNDPVQMQLVLQLIQAAIGDIKVELKPNIDEVTPGASVLHDPLPE